MKRQFLSPREKDIVNLILKNYSNPEIAEKLNLSKKSVSARISRIYIKYGVYRLPKPRQLLKNKLL